MADTKETLIAMLTGYSLDTDEDIRYVADELIAKGAVPVVRCRDCKYISAPTERGNFLCGRKMFGLVRPDDFCSFGERMDGDSNA